MEKTEQQRDNREPAVSHPSGVMIPVLRFSTPIETAQFIARRIAEVIRHCNDEGQNAVIGLAGGSTMVGVYRELIELHKQDDLDFSKTIIFGLTEYSGIDLSQDQSMTSRMAAQLFDHINIPASQILVPNTTGDVTQQQQECERIEEEIETAGGLDLVVLGVGSNGHIGFNEPFSVRNSRTRVCVLDPVTRRSAASDFFGEENVPTQGITLGLGTILSAKQVVLAALGEHKANVIKELSEGPITNRVPATVLQDHDDVTVCIDPAAASKLTDECTPWLLGNVQWDEALITRALVWLCDETGKALLKLDDDDFRSYNLHQLLRHHGPAHELAKRVFGWLMNTIHENPIPWPGSKKVICFSPHPDDDVISMGGTLIRLVEEGHETHIAYMTSGNIAVFDHDAKRVADLVTEYNHLFGIDMQQSLDVEERVAKALKEKQPGVPDSDAVLKIKGLIRWSEAKAGAIEVGCREENLHFLDLPFYRTGTVEKRPVGDADISIILNLLETVQPDVIYVAGDLSDPHGTHRVCAEAIFRAVELLEASNGKRPEVLLYRGAWQEYAMHEIDIAVPLSPKHMDTKRRAIFMHESQKDEALFPGSDPREFWERAEDRNRGTADEYNHLGLPEFLALEAFVVWDGEPI